LALIKKYMAPKRNIILIAIIILEAAIIYKLWDDNKHLIITSFGG